MAHDVPFLKMLLKHTLKIADRSEGQPKQDMLNQADRLRQQISKLQPSRKKK